MTEARDRCGAHVTATGASGTTDPRAATIDQAWSSHHRRPAAPARYGPSRVGATAFLTLKSIAVLAPSQPPVLASGAVQRLTQLWHPQTNGKTDSYNRMVLEG